MKRMPRLFVPLLALVFVSATNARPLQVDHAASEITFEARATMHRFSGTAESWTLDVDVSADGSQPKAARLVLELDGLKTGNESRDEEMMRWMERAEYPTIEFVLTGIASREGGYTATGDLTLHGVSRPISIPVSISGEGGRWSLEGRVAIDHREYGLKQFRKLGLLSVAPRVDVHFRIVGVES
jgi:polyisoprenoid-binding protein YceI